MPTTHPPKPMKTIPSRITGPWLALAALLSSLALPAGSQAASSRYEARLDATDAGVILRHGDGPDHCDANGMREPSIVQEDGRFYLFYDGCAAPGWLACLATSDDLKTWTKRGRMLSLGPPGYDDSGTASSPWLIKEGATWHMFYVACPAVTPAPDYVPAGPYLTMKATAPALMGPWTQLRDFVPFRPTPGTPTAGGAYPGHILKHNGEYLMFINGGQNSNVHHHMGRDIGLAWLDLPLAPERVRLQALPPSEDDDAGTALGDWIWHSTVGEQAATVRFLGTFDLPADAKPERARLAITADDAFTVWLNGVRLGSGDSWQQLGSFEVTNAVHAGINRLAIEAKNGGGPGGAIAGLTVWLPAGRVLKSGTSGAWRCGQNGGESWFAQDAPADRLAVQVLGTASAGPWNLVPPGTEGLPAALAGVRARPACSPAQRGPWRRLRERSATVDRERRRPYRLRLEPFPARPLDGRLLPVAERSGWPGGAGYRCHCQAGRALPPHRRGRLQPGHPGRQDALAGRPAGPLHDRSGGSARGSRHGVAQLHGGGRSDLQACQPDLACARKRPRA